MKSFRLVTIALFCAAFLAAASGYGSTGDVASGVLSGELLKVRYNLANRDIHAAPVFELSDDFATDDPPAFTSRSNYKSPAKAFFLSLAVPGLGQYYYGSRVKPFVFLGIEVASWVMYFNWHGEGDDITAEFEAFNRAHWSRGSYEDYLYYVYGVTDDGEVPPGTSSITHHLPDTYTQQYYEMTGKYDQFAWGWDDAVFEGNTLEFYSESNPPPEIITGETVPYSANRVYYETRRNDANNAYDKATRMVYVVLANRMVSAFEALFATKARNNKLRRDDDIFGHVDVKPSLKSLNGPKDTPYLTLTYKF